ERAVDIVSGCFFMIRRTLWDQLGGFDAAFTMYGEETDLCLRARSLGIRPRITPEATIIHYGGASETVRADKMVRLMRAKIELINRHFSPLTRGPGRVLFGLWPLSRAIAMKIGAVVLRRADLRTRAETWAEIWARRSEWRGGYSQKTP
ncbi:MAG: glycosyltransferase, partial [Paracoccaceae bacterium]